MTTTTAATPDIADDDEKTTYRCSLSGSLGSELLTRSLSWKKENKQVEQRTPEKFLVADVSDGDEPPVDLRAVC